MKKIIGLVVALAVMAGGLYGLSLKNKKKKAALSLSYATAALGTIESTVEATGEVTPLNRVEIKPPIAGRIEELLVDEGSRVKKGDILAWMSSSDRAAILDAARAHGAEVLKQWEDTYKPTPIIAPLTGVIILRGVVVGQTVDASTILFAMSDRLIVKAQVDEADIGRVHVGLPARLVLDAYPDNTIEGRVFQILFEGKNVSNVITYGVKIEPLNAPSFFRSQMTANVTLILAERTDTLLVPAGAIRESNGQKQVFLANPDGTSTPQTVRVGLEEGDNAEILEGLKPGDKIVLNQAKYEPQKGIQSSPLAMGGPRAQGQQTQRSGSKRSAGSR